MLIAGIASADGTITERYEYDAYGKPYILDADYTVDGSSDIANPYLFTGRQLDTLDSGGFLIQYSRARYYDYETGRWYQREPLGYVDGMGLYEYVKNRVVFYLNPLGLSVITEPPVMPSPATEGPMWPLDPVTKPVGGGGGLGIGIGFGGAVVGAAVGTAAIGTVAGACFAGAAANHLSIFHNGPLHDCFSLKEKWIHVDTKPPFPSGVPGSEQWCKELLDLALWFPVTEIT